MNCFTIAAGEPFLEALAGWVLARHGEQPAALPRALVLLPNRRACESLREAFLRAADGRPLLLPRIAPIGEVDEEEILWQEAAEILPAISPTRRQLLLMRLIMRFDSSQAPDQAAALARQLARFIDDVAREEIDTKRLRGLVPDDLARHWQQTLDFLTLVSQHWPAILQEEQALDPAEHRRRQLAAVADAWKNAPPDFPVIAAGSTGSQPATARLLAVVARLPQGAVVLPGLDKDMPEEEWKLVAETHPQFALKSLLERMECKREEVNNLLPVGEEKKTSALRAVLQPPPATAGWAEKSTPLNGLSHVRLMEADTPADEARLVAVALRETLETPGKTAALVTHDRRLARMAAAQMQRFGVTLDDSAGRRLADTPPASFLRLAMAAAASGAAPADLLALLRHPLAAGGIDTALCRLHSRTLEYRLLRGVRRASGLDAPIAAAGDFPVLREWLESVRKQFRQLADFFTRGKDTPFASILRAHLAFAEWLATTPDESGAERLWAGDAGNALAEFMAELAAHADLLPRISPASYPGMLESLLAEQKYWPRFGLHPRLSILSPQEARMQRYDRVILAGLNEGSWPPPVEADPWMSRPMRKAFGLPAAERAVGQSAHDFFLLCHAPEVLLSRARKVEGAPAVPSRWLVRMEVLLEGKDPASWQRMTQHDYAEAAASLEAPLSIKPLPPPAPVPPLIARPREMRVTAIDHWLRDPYAIYARYILKLEPLDPLDQDPGAAELGSIIHRALEKFSAAYPEALPEEARKKLLACARDAFAGFLDRPAVACLWWPRFEAMADWIIEQEKERRARARAIFGEVKGQWKLMVDGKPFILTTRIDRLEARNDGTALIADYKTGAVPTQAEIDKGLANQLPLEALIVREGVLSCLSLRERAGGEGDTALEYWKLAANPRQCEIVPVEADLTQTRKRLEDLIRRFDDPREPYAAQINPALAPRHSDYAHLTRRQEWGEG